MAKTTILAVLHSTIHHEIRHRYILNFSRTYRCCQRTLNHCALLDLSSSSKLRAKFRVQN